jgi:hypothetical protein
MKRGSGWLLVSTILTIAIAAAVLFVSPLTLVLLDRFFVLDWSRLSNIGQSYTGVSALLSAGALIAVVVTVQLQIKQARLTQQQATKSMQFELLRLVLNQPDLYGPIVGFSDRNMNKREIRQHAFATMWIRYASFVYETGEIDESVLREELFAETFASEEGRRWCHNALPSWDRSASRHPHRREFVSIMHEEYGKAVSNALSADTTTTHPTNREGTRQEGGSKP